MFSRILLSLTKPPQTIRFAKDSWIRVIGHLLSVPLFLLLPLLLSAIVAPGMPQDRYARLVDAISADFRTEGAVIAEGKLVSTAVMTASFDHFLLVMGDVPETMSEIVIVFANEGVSILISDVVLETKTYDQIGLANHDFNDMTAEALGNLAVSIRELIESNPMLRALDWMILYMTGLIDYILMALFMTIVMMLFTANTPFLFKVRLKLSVYLTTVYVFSQLLLVLFGLDGFETVSVLLVYVWHVWAFRSFAMMRKGDPL